MEDKVTIFIHRESTGQRIKIKDEDALKSYQEIKKALLGKKYSTDFGLLGSDFRIDVIKKDSKSEIYECYDRGYIIKDDNNSYVFEYGNNWYKEFEAELKKILQDDPYAPIPLSTEI